MLQQAGRIWVGSPPRMRGKDQIITKGKAGVRITPAYAGKRGYRIFRGLLCRDHPRVCGEKNFMCGLYRYDLGSPPRMRGKEDANFNVVPFKGITPAYAGKSGGSNPVRNMSRDHPRVCGEKGISYFSGAVVSGSPPRMRGKVAKIAHISNGVRITPAHAGKSCALDNANTLC